MGNCVSSKSGVDDKEEKDLILTPNDVNLIKNSWKSIVKGGLAQHGTTMMIKIFLEHKELKHLWKFAKNLETEDQMNSNQMLKAHGEKLFNGIDMAVNSLDDLNTLVPILIQLGYSHGSWGVKEEHFPIIGAVLINTLQDSLKAEFTPKVKKAWIKVFGVIEAQMKIGMRQRESEIKAPKQTRDYENNYDAVNGGENGITASHVNVEIDRDNGHIPNGTVQT